MQLRYPSDMVGRKAEWKSLTDFATSGDEAASLGVVWGRRRVGKSFLLESLVEQSGGFYYGAVRGSSAEALRELGERIGAFQGTAAPLALEGWDRGIGALLALGGHAADPTDRKLTWPQPVQPARKAGREASPLRPVRHLRHYPSSAFDGISSRTRTRPSTSSSSAAASASERGYSSSLGILTAPIARPRRGR